MRLRKRSCYYCVCNTEKKRKPLKVFCNAISDYVDPNGLCDKFKKEKNYRKILG